MLTFTFNHCGKAGTLYSLMADTAAMMITRLDSTWLDLTSLDSKKFSGGAYTGPHHDAQSAVPQTITAVGCEWSETREPDQRHLG